MKTWRRFPSKVLRTARSSSDAAKGEVEIMFAMYGVPDTEIAIGNTTKETIETGAFAAVIARNDYSKKALPIFADHGEATGLCSGGHKATLKIGKGFELREIEEGAIVEGAYNLQKEISRDLFSDLQFDPEGAQFSFAVPQEGTVKREDEDGSVHVLQFGDLYEVSQVGFGAQESAHLVSARSDEEIDAMVKEALEDPDYLLKALGTQGFKESLAIALLRDRKLAADVRAAAQSALEPDEVAVFLSQVLASRI